MYLFFVNKSLKKKKKREKARSWRSSSKSVKCWLCRDVIIKKNPFFSKSVNIWSMMQNKNKEMEIKKIAWKKVD